MTVLAILKNVHFGQRVAEEETDQLSEYFVETDHWNQLLAGNVDVVYGPKGAGKSALYSLLVTRSSELFDRQTLLVPCENPRGAPAFKSLATDPPATEQEFVALWKLYFACLLSGALSNYGITGTHADFLRDKLRENGLVTETAVLQRLLNSVYDYVKRLTRPAGIEFGASVDPGTQMPSGVSAKIIFSEPTESQRKRGYASVDELLEAGNQALSSSGYTVWLLMDRLDVAFSESAALEANALRALFRAYLDLRPFDHVRMKIFLRTDIWKAITSSGFREASHITRHLTIEWSSASLMNLVVRRAAQNSVLLEHYKATRSDVLRSSEAQESFFHQMFPRQVDIGASKPATFDWMLSRVRDGTKQSAPRELIHLLNALRNEQVRMLEVGKHSPDDGLLFHRSVFRDALSEVSRTRLEQTLYAEYPELRDRVEKLRAEKTQQSFASLAKIWQVDAAVAERIARSLVEVGFFEQRGSKHDPALWVPFLYRDALDMVQGSAED
jgi:hypothetical protein